MSAAHLDSDESWVALPNLGKHRRAEDGPVSSGTAVAATLAPKPRPDPDEAPIQPILYPVRPGETFRSIAEKTYGSDRFARALWAANKRQVPSMDRLPSGTTIRLPAPESLNSALVDPPGPDPTAPRDLPRPRTEPARRDGAASLASASGEPSETLVMLPVGRPSSGVDPIPAHELDGLPDRPRAAYPIFVARPHDTFRTIARDTLGDAERADEVRQLNLDVISDPARPTPGQKLRLPRYAKVK